MNEIVKNFRKAEIQGATTLAALVTQKGDSFNIFRRKKGRVLIFGNLVGECTLDKLVRKSIHTVQGKLYSSLEPLTYKQLESAYNEFNKFYGGRKITHVEVGTQHFVNSINGDRYMTEFNLMV